MILLDFFIKPKHRSEPRYTWRIVKNHMGTAYYGFIVNDDREPFLVSNKSYMKQPDAITEAKIVTKKLNA